MYIQSTSEYRTSERKAGMFWQEIVEHVNKLLPPLD